MVFRRQVEVKLVKPSKNDTVEPEETSVSIPVDEISVVLQRILTGALILMATNAVCKIAVNRLS